MTIRWFRNKNSLSKTDQNANIGNSQSKRTKFRRYLLEALEPRQLMAVGPQLIGIQQNTSELLKSGDVLTQAPRELVFRFDDAQLIDASTVSGIRITRAGGDGSFDLASATSDFGSTGRVNIQFTAAEPGRSLTMNVTTRDLLINSPPTVGLSGNTISLVLNSNSGSPTTADQLVSAINTSTALNGAVRAKIHGGLGSTRIGANSPSSYSPIVLSSANDSVVVPGAVLVGQAPDQNEVTVRFAEALKDDNYRIEIFGFDDPGLGIVGLRNVPEGSTPGNLFKPSLDRTRKDTIDFRLDLGPQVVSVVPQPTYRVNGQLQQQRDTIVVYFDNDKLLVENDAAGRPTARSVENPEFYQLIFTSNTVRNTDDLFFNPTSVAYNAAANTATLIFDRDINDLPGSSAGASTFRLRIGTRETAPLPPARQEAAATAISDLNTNGAAKVRFTSLQVGEAGSGVQVIVTNSGSNGLEVTTGARSVTVNFGGAVVTAQEFVDAIRNSIPASALVSVDFEPGSNFSTIVSNKSLAYSPVTLLGLGSTFDTSLNLGTIGSALTSQTSLVLSSAIEPERYLLDLQGASDDAAHRRLAQNLTTGFEDHVNPSFGADKNDGITTIYYNFRATYATTNTGLPMANAINAEQRARAREVLALWSKYVGVQFVETADIGLTIAAGPVSGILSIGGTQFQNEGNFGVRIDTSFQNSLIVLSATNTWGTEYGASYSRTMAAAVGMALGLHHAGDLPETTLMRLDPVFLAGSGPLTDINDVQLTASDERYEPVYPGNQDILHGRFIHRPDGTDIDLYRFEVDLGTSGQVGLLTAETYAQRLGNSSPLNTNISLFRQKQAVASTSFGATVPLSLSFEAVKSGAKGNQLQIFFTQSDKGANVKPTIIAFPNALSIDLNDTVGSESTAQDVIDAINNSPAASSLVRVRLTQGVGTTKVGSNVLTQNPVVLSGGDMELVSQNDDYFSQDSLIKMSLGTGVYFLGVSASGNADYNGAVANSGFGGQSQGNYELRLTFRAAVDTRDAIQDMVGTEANGVAVGFDGDADGKPGGTHDFWFQTRPLDRVINFNAGGSASLEGRTVTVIGGNGVRNVFEFDTGNGVQPGRFAIPFSPAATANNLASALATAINGRTQLGVVATAFGSSIRLTGERSITIDSALRLIDVQGKTIFVDKSAGPNADGSLARPFNNISASDVPNAFGAAQPGDIVRIVGNGGNDGNLATVGDNFAYEIGRGLLSGSVLSDGISMDVPRGVTTIIDAGAAFKLRDARIGVGSSNVNIDRSGGVLQVLGAPVLLDANGNAQRTSTGAVANGRVYFTSWLDESIGLDTYLPTTTPTPGNWGGISISRELDVAAGRRDLENEGIFLQHINFADIRFGGGTFNVESVTQTFNPIELLGTRATVTDNVITRSSSAAISALPSSFEETNFNEPRFQTSGSFTSDYDRVGPNIKRNTLLNNSVNGLFIRVDSGLNVPGRFDDTDIVHVLTDNLVVNGNPGGALLDSTVPPSALISLGPNTGGLLQPGFYNYKITFVDRNGYESIPSDPSVTINLLAGQTAVSIASLPGATGDFVERRIYRSQGTGTGPYDLVANLDRNTSTFLDAGQFAGGTLIRDRADVSTVALTEVPGGTLAAGGRFTYRVVMVDAGGREGLASNTTSSIVVGANSSVRLDNLPRTLAGFVGRRVYRSANGGGSPFQLIAELQDGNTSFVDTGANLVGTLAPQSLGVQRPRLNASLVIDPGMVIKSEAARIELTFGASLIAEGLDGLPIVFTSRQDDTVGAGGTFDTNNNRSVSLPRPGDWGGIYAGPTSNVSLDHARIAFGGGVTRLDSTFRAFNALEIHQADARIAHTLFENNANGFGGQGPGTRLGRLSNERATIFVRGAQPVIVDNIFRGNAGSAITIDLNSMTDDFLPDPGRQTGSAERNSSYLANRGPLIRDNRLFNNGLNGLNIRAGQFLTTASVWDDTDIVHVVTEEIFVGNVQHEGGLRLQSAPTESLVVKFDGYGSNFNRNLGAGLTANGQLTSARDRVGGTIHLVGQPGFPVILTSLKDDTAGAGLQPDGKPQTDTNNDGIGSVPQAADWRGILLDQYSNDRNVAMVLETEDFAAAAPGPNGFVGTAQVLGVLAANTDSGDENRRLGFVVSGVLSQAEDVDVYSFTGVAGSEIWLDIDYTRNNLDLVIEFLNANGELLARSDNSTFEASNPSLIFTSDLIDRSNVNPLATRTVGTKLTAGNVVKEDGTVNPLDPGMRIRLPGANGTPGSYFVRVRSASTNADASGAGLSSGSYELQVRLREAQEFAGSTVNYTDIRYATNGVRLRGLPGESPLIGEAAEDESVRNGASFANNDTAIGNGIQTGFGGGFFFGNIERQIGNRPQYLGNILETAKGGFSVAGNLSSFRDVDFYMFQVNQEDLVGSLLGGHASVVFDMDYADGLNRPDTSINVFVEEPSARFGTQYRLVFSSDSSNIADDQGRPLSIADVADLSRGSTGTADPFIGPIALPEGNYLVAISSAAYQPRAKLLSPANVKPISSVRRIVDENAIAGTTTADLPVVQNFLPANRTIGASGVLTSARTFNLGAYAAADLPNLYLDYSSLGGTFEVFVRESSGAEFAVASSTDASLLRLIPGANNSVKIPLSSINARPAGGGLVTRSFAGQDGLSLVFRGPTGTRIDNVIIGFAERGESVGVANEPILLGQGNIFAPAGLQGSPLFPPFLRGNPGSFVQTRPFTLTTYDPFFDGPQVAFDYEVFNGQMDVFVIDADDPFFQVRIATTVNQNLPLGFPLLVTGRPASAVIDISQYGTNFATGADRRLQVEFRARNDDPSRTVIRNVVIQLLNGARVGSGEPNPTFAVVPVPSTTVTTGAYQLEVRLGDQFFNSNSTGGPTLTRSIDTNDRLAEQITLVAPAGSTLTDGDRFTLSDGGRTITFEFSTDATVGLGNVPVRFTPADANFVVARAIRDAVNSSGVQAQFQGNIRAASSNGTVAGTSGRDAKIDLHGSAYFNSVQSTNPAGRVTVIFHQGVSDRNIRREQSQVIIQNSYIRESRDYGIFSEAPARLQDPRDVIDPFDFFDDRNTVSLQNIPKVAGTQAVRNLLQPNNSVQGGLVPGIVVQNNVLEEGGLGGVIIQGETPIWMISPGEVPYTFNANPNAAQADYNPFVNTPGTNPPTSHFGSFIDDGDLLVLDADRTRIRLEFDDLAGGATGNPVAGSGQVEGNGIAPDSSMAWYRDTGGSFYQRLTCTNCTAFATNAYETMHALRDSILSSMLVSNGTTHTITATVAESMLGPDPLAPPTSFSLGYPEYFNRPAIYLEGVSTIQYLDVPGGFVNPFDIRQLDLGEMPQPQARIVNNTIIGRDGRASFHSDSAMVESNDTIATATQTLQGTAHNPLFYSDVAFIGDGSTRSSASTAGGSGNGGNFNGSGAGFSNSQFILALKEGTSKEAEAQFLASQGLEVIRRFDFIKALLVRPAQGAVSVALIDRIDSLPEVRYAEADMFGTYSRTPNDVQYPQQWHYDNRGQTGGTVDADIDLPEAWDNFTGSSQTVIAIIDSGVDYNHPDLRANMWVNPGEIAGDGIDNDGNGYVDDIHGIDPFANDSDPMDQNGHGTHVAGTTSAVGNNGIGVTGVNWNSKIMALKIGAAGPAVSFAAAVESLNYLVTMKTRFGINIVVSNNSYGGPGGSQAFFDAIRATNNAGIVFVAAAGNSSSNNDTFNQFPADFDLPGIITVAATDHNDRLAGFSNFGRVNVDLGAPGVDILSTTMGGGYGLLSGTSMASPHVAGVVALLAGAVPGSSVASLKSAILLGADPLAQLTDVTASGARLNAAKSLFVLSAGIGGNATQSDVDIYQFKLGVGERAIVDIDSAGSGLDSYLQIFDSRGVAQTFTNAFGERKTFSDNDAAPGEALSLDSFADFTATSPGVYYAAVSSVGNTSFDPLSSANRRVGTSTGAYRVTVSARHLQDFVIIAEDANQYQDGDTFTIFGIPDIDGTGSSGRTFEFTFGAFSAVAPGNIPIHLNANWRFPDVAQAITRAVNEGINRGPSISNFQQLPNGIFGLSSPLPPVHARALGGIGAVIDAPFRGLQGDKDILINALSAVDEFGTNQLSDLEIRQQISGPFTEVNQGLQLFPRRLDGVITFTNTVLGGIGSYENITSLSNLGIGHDRLSTVPISDTSLADGTSERFVVIKNAAWINGNGSIIVDPDVDDNNNLDQLLPETGVLATRGASPTILNNVFYNVQTPIVNEESRVNQNTFLKAPYGTNNPNVVNKPGQVVIGGSVYQHYETASSSVRFGTGIETSPTNVPNTAQDQNLDVPSSTRLFMNAQAGQYFPAPASPIIDSSVNRLSERTALASVKTAMGLPVSDLFAPDYDLVGQLRADDPNYAPPGGIGQNVFKDRGALDRADFIGPTAILLDPIDNDSLGVDRDDSVSVVRLTGGVYPEFRIQLKDGNEPTNPLRGIGVDDNSVINSTIANLRVTGAAVVLTENGRLLVEGIDYRFEYNANRDEIVLTPLAGVWRSGSVYDITINNKDRFVIDAASGDQISDGDQFTITDNNGGVVYFEFDSGFRLQLPQGLTIQVPIAGALAGGIADGDRFTINDGTRRVTFELDNNSSFLDGNRQIRFRSTDTQAVIAQAIVNAITSAGLAVSPRLLPSGDVYVGAAAGVKITTTFSRLEQPQSTLGLFIPAFGAVVDGQTFSLSDGLVSLVFEFDSDNVTGTGRTRVDISGASSVADLARIIQSTIASSNLQLTPRIIGNDTVHLGLPAAGTVDRGTTSLEVVGVSRSVADGQSFSITFGNTTKTFEFDDVALNNSVASGNIPIPLLLSDTQDSLGARTAAVIAANGLSLNPIHVRDGNIAVGGTSAHSISVANAPSLSLFGQPNVTPNTTVEMLGTVVLQVPTLGGTSLVDNSTFAIRANNRLVVFEFDGNISGPSAAGNVVIPYTAASTASEIVDRMVIAINGAGLNIVARGIGNGRVDLGTIATSQVELRNSGLTMLRGNVTDGEFFTISNGTVTTTFEFVNVSLGGGAATGRLPILFSNSSTRDELFTAMKTAIESSTLGLSTTVIAPTTLRFADTPRFTYDFSGAPSLSRTGVPGGAVPVAFIQDQTFTGKQVAQSIVRAINGAPNTPLEAKIRGDNTLFVENAASISEDISNYFIRAVEDLAGNDLRPNRINNETQFTILMPGVELDYGDAPDPVTTAKGRYPTLDVFDGARHVASAGPLRLGTTVTNDIDGKPSPAADADVGDDGVTFKFQNLNNPMFNRNVDTQVTVTLSAPGFVDAWIDFNSDGDWTDPGEQVIRNTEFTTNLTRTFQIRVPSTSPVPPQGINSFARFRTSSAGNHLPTGLALDGEVEDYLVRILPGIPPTGVTNVYTMDEDQQLVTTDPDGLSSPGFVIDDGVLANDVNPESRVLSAILVSPPQNHNGVFTLNPNGTFTYIPKPDFFGIDTFVYRGFVTINAGRGEIIESLADTTVTIDVRPVNDPPTASNVPVPSEDLVTNEDQALQLTEQQVLQRSRASAGPLNEQSQTLRVSLPLTVTSQSGSVSISNGVLTYTPRADFVGVDTFVFTVTDNGVTGTSADPRSITRTMTVRVLDVNDPPITTPKQGTIVEDNTFTRPVAFFLQGDSPVEAGQNVVFVFDTNSSISTTSTQGGTVTFDGTNVRYTPALNFNGTDTFFYLVTDNGPNPTNSVGTVTMTVTPFNDPPEKVVDFPRLTLAEDAPEQAIDLRLYFRDPDVVPNNDLLTYRVKANSNSTLANITFAGNTMFVRPLADQHGTAVVEIEARDISGATVVNVLNIEITPVEDAPRLASPLPDISVNEDAPINPITLFPTHFFDPDVVTNNDRLAYDVEVNNQNLVTATVVNGQLRLTLLPNVSGSARVTVTARDLAGNVISDSFDVLVNAVNDGPVGSADVYDVPRGSAFTTTDATGALTASKNDDGVLANDVDAEGNSFTARLVPTSLPRFGTVTLNLDGTFTYRTNAQAVVGGTDTFEYEGVDSFGAVGNRTTVTIRIGNPLPSPHRNPSQLRDSSGQLIGNLDVNADGNVSAIDVLIVVNFINANGSVSVSGLSAPPPYRDVDGDFVIGALDVLAVVNYLNSRSNFSGNPQGEGESQVMMVGVDSTNSSNLAWSRSVSRDNLNVGVALSNVVVGPAQPSQSNNAKGMSLADYLAGFAEEEEGDDIATALVSNVDPGNELLDAFFADSFLE